MPGYAPSDIRNICVTGHAGAGKTTLIEALLQQAGRIGKPGTIEEGNTVCDFEPEEKEHKHSLNAAVVHFEHEGKQITLVDTPGYPDFLGQTFSAFPAVETVAVVIGADRGIQTTTRRVMAMAEQRKLPRMIVINKISEHLDDLEQLVETIRETFGSVCVPLNLPTPDGGDVVDLWEKSDGKTLFSSAADARTALIDQIVEVDEDLMAAYLEQGQDLKRDQLHDAFEEALRQAHLVPIVFCSGKNGIGTDDLLHLIAELCPSPPEGNPRPFELLRDDGRTTVWHANPEQDDATFVAHVFKVTTDQFVGKLSLLRVHQGKYDPDVPVYLGESKKPLRLGHIFRVFGKDHTEIKTAVAGDIIAVAKVDDLHVNSVLHGPAKDSDIARVRFTPVPMPKPMYGLAVKAKNRGDEAKISNALHKLVEEDPTFTVQRVHATGETVISGMGELHMRIILEKLSNRFKVEVETHPPKVPYKETITAKAEGHHRHKKQTGGAGQFGEVKMTVEPFDGTIAEGEEPVDGLVFVDDTVGGVIPRQFMPAIEKGVRQVLSTGAFAGYPLTGVRVRIIDGKYHPVDSKEVAFTTAGKRAFIDAIKKARPTLLEPIVSVEITAPQTAMGDITSDLSGKRGQVLDTDMLPGDMCIIHAKVPLAEMNAYSSQLKSITAGQGSFVMDYSHDEQTPPNVQQEVIAAFKPEDDED
ncbi:MAG: elongation factor G [Phycisphaerales bacterium]